MADIQALVRVALENADPDVIAARFGVDPDDHGRDAAAAEAEIEARGTALSVSWHVDEGAY